MTNPDIDLLDVTQIRALYFVTRGAVANWVRRGKLEKAGQRGKAHLYQAAAVHRAATTRRPQHRGAGGRYTPPPAETPTPHAQ
jgi:hypothetical protein